MIEGLRIAILSTIENYGWAGTEEVWAQFAKIALKQGHEIIAAMHWRVAQSAQVKALQRLGLQVSVRHPFRPTRLYLLQERFYSDMKALESFRPDVLVINSGSLFDILNLPALRAACFRLMVPKVFFCHFVAEGFVPQDRDRVKAFAETMQGWIFVSQHNHQLAERQLAYRFNNAQVIPNGPRLVLENPLPWPTGKTVHFGCVARLETQWKGQDVLLAVLSQAQWRDRNWQLNIYGTGPEADYIQQLIAHYQLTGRVICHGYVSDIQSVWQQNHLMLLPSRGEGMPLAVLEAMMCGRPTVTTDVGGTHELLTHQVTGWIAECATPPAFGKALETAWHARTSWPEVGVQAHQAARQAAQDNSPMRLLSYLKSIISKSII